MYFDTRLNLEKFLLTFGLYFAPYALERAFSPWRHKDFLKKATKIFQQDINGKKILM